MATPQQVIDAIMADMRVLSVTTGTPSVTVNMRGAPDEPPEKIEVYPFCVAWVESGTSWSDIPGGQIILMNIRLELHIARKDLPRDIEKAMPWLATILNAIHKPMATTAGDRFGGMVDAMGEVAFTFGDLGYGMPGATIPTIGFSFLLQDVKIQTNIT